MNTQPAPETAETPPLSPETSAEPQTGDASAQPAAVVATAVIDNELDASTHFAFKHKIFTIKNCRFALNGSDRMPCFYIPMGENTVAIELAKLQQEFNLPPDSVDAALLLKVQKGLSYVKEIRPNDSIPREILDGSASWSVDESHKELALAKLQMELIFWIQGRRDEVPALEQLKRNLATPKLRGQVKDAHAKICQLLKFDELKVSRDRVDEIARETTYIEALRERSYKLNDIAIKLASFYTTYKKEAAFSAEITRMQDLMRRAIKLIGERFNKVDMMLREVLKVVNEHTITINVVRSIRDEVHLELRKWDEYFPKWAALNVERDDGTEKFFRVFYRFLAENYMEQQSWSAPKKK
ncbi:MAG: hypothetical protein SFW65_08520 [Alphaproteobacteria bacterium]|nr:hypothetical protein [Alphaproteobacteria bacterium]